MTCIGVMLIFDPLACDSLNVLNWQLTSCITNNNDNNNFFFNVLFVGI